MPQLDFFTFTNQFLVSSFIFCGLYYFNLLFLLPRLRRLYLKTIFKTKVFIIALYIETVFLLRFYQLFFGGFSLHHLRTSPAMIILFQSFIASRVGSLNAENYTLPEKTSYSLQVTLLLSTIVLYFSFFKTVLVFNSEKLMLTYFICLIILFVIFSFETISNLFKVNLKDSLNTIYLIECYYNKLLNDLLSCLNKIINHLNFTFVAKLLTNHLKIKKLLLF